MLLVVSWSLPGSAYATVSPMEIVKYQLRKPNFLIVVESAESMQGIPGENATRFNEVGADCEKGDRFCRLYGQAGRCEFSGMGAQGYQFDYVSGGSGGGTSQISGTATMTVTQSGTGTLIAIAPTTTSTKEGPSVTATATGTVAIVTSQSATGTATSTATQTVSQAATQTASNSRTNTQATTQTSSTSQTNTQAATGTSSSSQTNIQTGTQTSSSSQTNIRTATQTSSTSQTNTQAGTQTSTASQTNTQTTAQTQSGSQTSTQTASQSLSASQTKSQTVTQTGSASQTNTQTGTASNSQSQTNTLTNTGNVTSSQSTTQTTSQSKTTSQSNTQTGTVTSSSSQTNTQTATQSLSSSQTNSQTATQSTSSSNSQTQTATQSNSNSNSNTQTATRSTSSSNSNTQTATLSSSSSKSNSGTSTQTLTNSKSNSNSGTQTKTGSLSGTSTSTASNTAMNIGKDTSIVGYWPLDEDPTVSPNKYADESGNNNDGGAHGYPTRVTPGAQPAFSTAAASFGTGNTDYVDVTGMTTASNAMTIAVWAKLGSVTDRQDLVAFTPGGDDAGNGLRLFVYPNFIIFDNNKALVSGAPPTGYGIKYNASYGSGAWGLIVATVNNSAGGNWNLYQFNNSCSQTTAPSVAVAAGLLSLTTASAWCFGAGCISGVNYFGSNTAGSLDEIRVWNRELTSAEAKNLCTSNYPKTSTPTGTSTASYVQTGGTSTTTATSTGTATNSYSSSLTQTSTRTYSSSSSLSSTSTYTNTASSSSSSSSTYTNTASSSSSSSSTYTNTSSASLSSSSTYTNTRSLSSSSSSTYTNTGTSTSSSTSSYTNTGSSSSSSSSTYTNTGSSSLTSTVSATNTATSSLTSSSSFTQTGSLSVTGTSTLTSTATSSVSASISSNNTVTSTLSSSGTYSTSGTSSVSSSATYTNTGLTSLTSSSTMTVTGTSSASNTGSYTYTGTSSASGSGSYTNTGTSSASGSGTSTYTGTLSVSSSATRTTTGTSSVTSSVSMTTTGTSSAIASITGTSSAIQSDGTGTNTTTVSQTAGTTGTVTQTATASSIGSQPDTALITQTVTGPQSLTGTVTTTSVLQLVPDLGACTASSCLGTSGWCYLNSTVACTADGTCSGLTPGDFCRYLNTNDGTGRGTDDFCADSVSAGGRKTCRYQATSCSSPSDCHGGVGDYCVDGTPAMMCQKTGLWCWRSPGGAEYGCASGDTCVPATSRAMMVKNAVRRVMLEHAYDDSAVVKMGHMHTFQADRSLNAANLFPYVKLDTSLTTSLRTEVKFLPRSELLKGKNGPCFSESGGPSSTCKIDYGAGGATSAPEVTYSISQGPGGYDSRYAVPTEDGKNYVREECAWSTCKMSHSFSSGNGLYEGSYYSFGYTWGTPVGPGDPNNPVLGSVYNPQYLITYKGKSFIDNGIWYLMDAERSEYVNENKYGANEFTSSTWSQGWSAPGTEYHLPLVGDSSDDPLSASATCNASNGAQWDYYVVPMVNATTFSPPPYTSSKSVTPTQKALMNAARLDKASFGGFYATGHVEPVACALDGPQSVAGYMSTVKSNDGTACWENHVLLVVDGLPRGPGDVAVGGVDCSAAACVYSKDHQDLSGCVCPAVTKARALAASGVNVHVIAATTDLTTRNWYAAATLNNIARAGSTSPSFINIPRYAGSEDELYYWLNYEMKEALRITVATTPASAASGTQTMQGVTAGNMLFQTTVELPEWRGNLVAFSIGTGANPNEYTTQLAWDAATVNTFTVRPGFPPNTDQQQAWKQRKVLFSDGSGEVYQIGVSSDGTIDPDTVDALYGLKMGGTKEETERIVQWMLGKIDPNDSIDHKPLNPAVMGSVLNSMPIDVGPPGPSSMPGGNRFWHAYAGRPELVYLGADDGMLHAFFAVSGQEAFAFIPADMIPVIAKLYAQGGQRYSPNDHVYGLAGSPKVKNVCVANCSVKTCSDDPNADYPDSCPQWKTILVMGVGLGGNRPFALDITDPVEGSMVTLDSDSLLWHAGYKNAGGINTSKLGATISVPAFAYNRTTSQNDYRVLMASGNPASGGPTLFNVTAKDGAAEGSVAISGSGTVEVVADVAVARDNSGSSSSPADQNLLATYVADTSGTVHQYYGSTLTSAGTPISLTGQNQPLHFSPAVVQLNRNTGSIDNTVFLAQVTNSILDPNTVGDSFPASELVVAKLLARGSPPPQPALDMTFGWPDKNGLIKLSAGTGGQLCGVTTTGNTGSGCGTGGSVLPATARPTGTPVAVLRSDGSGFQLYTTWYDPPKPNWNNCPASSNNGNSYITLHQFTSAGSVGWSQLYGMMIPQQYVTGVQFAGNTLFITYGDGTAPRPPELGNFGQSFISASRQMGRLSGDRFVRTAWTERLDGE